MAGVPLIKVGLLLFKTIVKPVAKIIKNRAGKKPLFRRACVWVGNVANRAAVRVNVGLAGGKVKKVKAISEDAAVSRGSEVLGESIIVFAGTLGYAYEYRRKDEEAAIVGEGTAIEEALGKG